MTGLVSEKQKKVSSLSQQLARVLWRQRMGTGGGLAEPRGQAPEREAVAHLHPSLGPSQRTGGADT